MYKVRSEHNDNLYFCSVPQKIVPYQTPHVVSDLPIFSFRQRPGELDYAELDEFRRHDAGHAPGPSGASAAAVVRPPAYEGTEYADITQFGVPQPDPTYANVSGGDVTYSNMQSM